MSLSSDSSEKDGAEIDLRILHHRKRLAQHQHRRAELAASRTHFSGDDIAMEQFDGAKPHGVVKKRGADRRIVPRRRRLVGFRAAGAPNTNSVVENERVEEDSRQEVREGKREAEEGRNSPAVEEPASLQVDDVVLEMEPKEAQQQAKELQEAEEEEEDDSVDMVFYYGVDSDDQNEDESDEILQNAMRAMGAEEAYVALGPEIVPPESEFAAPRKTLSIHNVAHARHRDLPSDWYHSSFPLYSRSTQRKMKGRRRAKAVAMKTNHILTHRSPVLPQQEAMPAIRVISPPPSHLLNDAYFWLVSLRWPFLLFGILVGYFAVAALFALLFLIEPDCVANSSTRDYPTLLWFSVQTISTIGYGRLAPLDGCVFTNLVVGVEAILGILMLAVLTGLVFSKFAMPTPRVRWSDVAVVHKHEGETVLEIRLLNERVHGIVSASMSCTMVQRSVTREGRVFRKQTYVPLVRHHSPLFRLGWNIFHKIDADSPLYNVSKADLIAQQTRLFFSFSGLDPILNQNVRTQFVYPASAILWNREFVDVITESEGELQIDFSLLSATVWSSAMQDV